MPLWSLRARGWLGGDTYGKRQYRDGLWVGKKGVAVQPYPIGRYGLGFNTSPYYSHIGWCYQVRRTWHGMVNVAMRPPISEQPKTSAQEANKAKFAKGVHLWQGMSQGVKDYYHHLSFPVHASGYNRFLHYFLTDKPC